jgi:hypothetical protein
MKTAAMSALVALGMLAGPALAETSEERAACTPDVWRLCASQIPSVEAIKLCLRRERASLSAACRLVMDAADRPVRTVAANRR